VLDMMAVEPPPETARLATEEAVTGSGNFDLWMSPGFGQRSASAPSPPAG